MYQINKLPNELLLKIFQYLNGKDLISCTLFNVQWNNIISSDKYLWLSIYEKEMNNKCLWLNSEIINLLNPFNMFNVQLMNDHNELSCNNNNNSKKYHKITDTILQISNNPSYCMKNLYSYYNTIQKLEEEIIKTNIIPYLLKLNNESICFNCAIFGPAIDTVHLADGFMHTLLNWIDLNYIINKQSIKLKENHKSNYWAGQGFILRLPKYFIMNNNNNNNEENNNNSEENNKIILLNTTILHSRKQMTRIRYCYGGSRLFGNCLVESSSSSSSSSSMNFTQHTINLLAGAQIIFYAIDIRKKDNRIFNNTLDNSILLINPYHSEEERWNEVRIELNALTNCLTSTQILIILGIGDQYSNNNNNNDSNEYNLIELAINLGFGYKSCKDNEQKEEEIDKIQSNNNHHYQGIKPLDKAYLNWRLWCTTSDGTNYTNLEEIFFWTIITYLSKSSLVNRISDESLKNRIKTMQNRITNYYRALFV